MEDQNTPTPSPASAEPEVVKLGSDENSNKNGKKANKKIIMIMVAVVAVVGIGAAAYFLLVGSKETPQEKLNNAVVKSLNEVETLDMTMATNIPAAGSPQIGMTISGDQTNAQGELTISMPDNPLSGSLDIKISFFATTGKLYLRAEGLQEVIDLVSTTGSIDTKDPMTKSILSLVSAFEDSWVLIDLVELQETANQFIGLVAPGQTIPESATTGQVIPDEVNNQLTELYKKHPFFVVAEGSEGSRYKVSFDRAAYDQFASEARSLDYGESVKDPNAVFDQIEESLNQMKSQGTTPTPEVFITINEQGFISKVEINAPDNQGGVSMDFTGINEPKNLTEPQADKQFKPLLDELLKNLQIPSGL